jgi:type II secretory pathway component PulF
VPAGLKAVEERIASPYFRMAIRDVSRDIENGSALSTAMARHPDVFSMSYVAAVQYGEQTATLDLVMISLGQGKPIHVRPQWHRRLARRRKGV